MTRALLLAALVLTTRASGQTGSFVRFRGGGPSATDCMFVTDVAGVPGGKTVHCTDGDPTCDADARPDGTCVFGVRICLDTADVTNPRCHVETLTGTALVGSGLDATALADALHTVPMPVSTADTCTPPEAVSVRRRGRHSGQGLLCGTADMTSGGADRDRVRFVCHPPRARTATFATLERKVFTRSCSTASCHGAANAGGMTLADGAAFAGLVGVPATNPAARAAGLLRVAPGDPANSFLLRKLEGTLASDEGSPMPQVGGPLPRPLIELVRRWIAAGAPADASF